jgi:hypothetical protein
MGILSPPSQGTCAHSMWGFGCSGHSHLCVRASTSSVFSFRSLGLTLSTAPLEMRHRLQALDHIPSRHESRNSMLFYCQYKRVDHVGSACCGMRKYDAIFTYAYSSDINSSPYMEGIPRRCRSLLGVWTMCYRPCVIEHVL